MQLENKFKLLAVITSISVIAIIGLSIYIWQMNTKIDSLEKNNTLTKQDIPNTDPRSPNWDPWKEMDQMKKQMDEMMQTMPSRQYFNRDSFFASDTAEITMKETKKEYIVEIEVPNDQLAEISTEIKGNMLTIQGSFKSIKKQSDDASYFSSQSQSRFRRSLTLQEPIDEKGINTEQKDDKIIITIAKNSTTMD